MRVAVTEVSGRAEERSMVNVSGQFVSVVVATVVRTVPSAIEVTVVTEAVCSVQPGGGVDANPSEDRAKSPRMNTVVSASVDGLLMAALPNPDRPDRGQPTRWSTGCRVTTVDLVCRLLREQNDAHRRR